MCAGDESAECVFDQGPFSLAFLRDDWRLEFTRLKYWLLLLDVSRWFCTMEDIVSELETWLFALI